MTTAREAFLKRVKDAVAQGNRAGFASKAPERSGVGYQGAGANPVQRFCQEIAAAGGKGYVAGDHHEVNRIIEDILQAHGARKILLSKGGVVDRLDIPSSLRAIGMDVMTLEQLPANPRDAFFSADIGITNVHRLIAETGTVVLASKPDEPRSVSLLPPVHIALADRSQLLSDLFDLFDLYSPVPTLNQSTPPSCLTLVTGPSKTGDIELKLVTGVHGPGEVHVIILEP